MQIVKYEIMPQEEFLRKLRQVRLKGFDRPFVYRGADIKIVKGVDVETLTPPQRYVLKGSIDVISDLYHTFMSLGLDIFNLESALLFWSEGSDPDVDKPIPFLPPIVEDSSDREGRKVILINDGMHRCATARKLRRSISIVHISGVSEEYPYYAYPFAEGWEKIVEFDELPDQFEKKDYRNPSEYKIYFRQFNEVFPGIQEQRKQSNPAHIKA